MLIEINNKLFDDIREYVNVNSLGDINQYIEFLIRKSFNIERYGENPFQIIEKQQNNNKIENKKEEENIENTNIILQNKSKKKVRIIKND